ncbi:uncharacterized protein LOC120356242 [Nilaparvata lugens]|uniref:uncharacterized protein LOC120356242 n=1 Tax=Nilaparvata lugens TaxID=108931 RepID=UPI00193CF086|nr:uncharacterized protein LOC120356242 [Nilaparvata lugens]
MDKSHRASSSSFLLPDSPPPERELNYWEQQKQQKKQQKSLSSATTSAVASTSGASSDPLKKQGIFVQDEDSSIIIPDSSPLPQATWAPRRAALTSVPAPKQSVKRGLFVDDDEEPGVLTQSKKRVVDEDSSITPLLREEEEAENEMETEELLAIINRTERNVDASPAVGGEHAVPHRGGTPDYQPTWSAHNIKSPFDSFTTDRHIHAGEVHPGFDL